MEPITSFSGQHRFLSNFYAHPFVWGEHEWPTSEHAYQASKTNETEASRLIRLAVSPGEAKRMGRRVSLRPDWEAVKQSTMLGILIAKFSDPYLASLLDATGDAELIEGNSWGDRYWGRVEISPGQWEGENFLGKALMQIRHWNR